MNQENWKIILDYLSDQEDVEKKKLLNEWLVKDPLHQQELEQAMWLWKQTAAIPVNDEWKDSFQVIQKTVQNQTHKNTVKLWPKLAFASAVAAAVIAGLFIFLYQSTSHTPPTLVTWISKTAKPGKMLNVHLPDSSEIWLNSGSSISYPENLKHAMIRTVKLKGEAFFKVKRDPAHPFVVKSQNLQTRVLGTSFNIRAWPGYNAEVTVLTGKVAVSKDSAGRQSAAIHLLPNQKAVYQQNSAVLSLQNIDEATLATSWTTGCMEFDQLPLKEVFETIERKYAVQLVTTQTYKNCKLTAHFRNISLTEVLKTLELTLGIHYTINNNIIYIKGGTCN